MILLAPTFAFAYPFLNKAEKFACVAAAAKGEKFTFSLFRTMFVSSDRASSSYSLLLFDDASIAESTESWHFVAAKYFGKSNWNTTGIGGFPREQLKLNFMTIISASELERKNNFAANAEIPPMKTVNAAGADFPWRRNFNSIEWFSLNNQINLVPSDSGYSFSGTVKNSTLDATMSDFKQINFSGTCDFVEKLKTPIF